MDPRRRLHCAIVVRGSRALSTDWLWFGEIGFRSVFTTSLLWRVGLFLRRRGVRVRVFLRQRQNCARVPDTGLPGPLRESWRWRESRSLANAHAALSAGAAVLCSFSPQYRFGLVDGTFLKGLNGVPRRCSRSIVQPRHLVLPVQATADFRRSRHADHADIPVHRRGDRMYWMRNDITLPPRRASAKPRRIQASGSLLVILVRAARQCDTGSSASASFCILHHRPTSRTPATPTSTLRCPVSMSPPSPRSLPRRGLVAGDRSREGHLVSGIGNRFLRDRQRACDAGIVPAAYQKFVVAPNELARETPYLATHIAATRRAWRLDSVETRDLEGDVQLSMADIRANAPTIDNVRLWERDLLQADVRPASGDPHVLRLRVGERRSIHDRRPIPAGPPLGARAQHRVAADAQLHQRAADVHARHGRHDGAREPGDDRRTAGAVHQGSAAGVDDLAQGHAAADLLRRAHERATSSSGPARRSSTIRPATTNVYTNYTGRGGVPVGSFLATRALRVAVRLARHSALGVPRRTTRAFCIAATSCERATAALPFLDFDAEPYLVVDRLGRAEVDSRRVHVERQLAVRAAARRTARTTCATASRS